MIEPRALQGWPDPLEELLFRLRQQAAVLVTVQATQGSVPRDVGAWMAVFPDRTLVNTIGGGRLEFDAQFHAQALLAGERMPLEVDYPLGPSLGQCCGGRVGLRFELVAASDAASLRTRLTPPKESVALFGAGHVARALVPVLASLPLDLTWIDSRDAIFPEPLQALAACEYSDPVQGAVPGLAAGSRVLIMSFSHAEDLAIVAACLTRLRQRDDLPYIGLIGSKTKWAKFQARLREQGFSDAELARVTCPIGIAGISDKRPAVIAIAVAAQLLQVPATVLTST